MWGGYLDSPEAVVIGNCGRPFLKTQLISLISSGGNFATVCGRFMAEIRKMLSARACIRPSFSTADEILARRWFNTSVPLDRIGQAILLGCARKYVAWRNNQAVQGPISALRYFEPILEEIEKQKLDPDYWEYLRFRIQRQEKLWIEKHREGNASASNTKEAADES